MNNSNIPANSDLPTMARLIKSTVIAILIAALILVTVVLPAEYGIDPTGVGRAVGLLRMGEIKVSLAEEAAGDRVRIEVDRATVDEEPDASAETTAASPAVELRFDEMTITLEPDQGKEIKLTMTKGAEVDFIWFTDGGRANFDAHADSKALEISYHNYEKGSSERGEGVLKAAFDGNHGWFWRNRTSETMKVTLQVKGVYSDIKKMI